MRDVGGLLAGFSLTTIVRSDWLICIVDHMISLDTDEVIIEFPDMLTLMNHLKG